jgi:DNA modification methylase
MSPSVTIIPGDCRIALQGLPDASIDAVVTDPPYPEIDRPYGRMMEFEWLELMFDVMTECRRVLKPTGSAMFVLQPNSFSVGSMRTWAWDFMVMAARHWNIIQDAYWWNPAAMPTVHCNRKHGLMRQSVKLCVWLGNPDCYRAQDEVLWSPSDAAKNADREDRALRTSPSGHHKRAGRMAKTADERGGVTPFNLLPCSNTGTQESKGHPAGTPETVLDWWVRYICPPGGTVLDPFAGSGKTGLVAIKTGRNAVLCEQYQPYLNLMVDRFVGGVDVAMKGQTG